MATNHNLPSGSDEAIVTETEHSDKVRSPLEEAHERFGIDLDAPEVIRRTLEVSGFTMLELEDPYTLPTFEEWITERMDQGYSGYNYGCFVMNEAGQIGFAKVHYGPDNLLTTVDENGDAEKTKVGGPEREADVLEALNQNGYEAPEVLGYNPASPEDTPEDEKMYELLVIEAVLPEYGFVRKREDWTPQLAQIAAQKIATFAKPAKEIPLFENESIALPVEDLVAMLPQTGDTYEQTLRQVLEAYPHLDDPIVVHGDAWFNNIIASHDDSDLMFVDWELAGTGYQGQDAGRKLWDLTVTNDWRLAEYAETAGAFTDEWCKTDDDRATLEFGVVYESLRWISERMRDINDPKTDDATKISLLQEIDDVKAHTLTVLEGIAEER